MPKPRAPMMFAIGHDGTLLVHDGREWVPGEAVAARAILAALLRATDLRRVESALAELAPEVPLEWRARLAKLLSERGKKALDVLLS